MPENGYYILEVLDYGGILGELAEENESITMDKWYKTLRRDVISSSINNDGNLDKYPDMPRFDTYEEAKEVLDWWRKKKLIEPDEYDQMDIIFSGVPKKKYYICKIEFME